MNAMIALSMGDFNGIGPEIILKSVAVSPHSFILFGHKSVLNYYSDKLSLPIPDNLKIVDVIEDAYLDIEPGYINENAGRLSVLSIERAVQACLDGNCDALVTAPISKQSCMMGGLNTPGHTEFLARICSVTRFGMMLCSEKLRVALVTIHTPLNQIFEHITTPDILKILLLVRESLHTDFALQNPRIAILGLNPHAGESGLLGHEETEAIIPAIREAERLGIHCNGPFPADGYFGSKGYENYDATLAMYHDQGLIAFKTIAFHDGVNYTMGLPIIRTSPDHGTAFSIAGTGQASPESFSMAINTAVTISNNRKSKNKYNAYT